MRSLFLIVVFAVVAMAAACVWCPPGMAAVRQCKPSVSSGLVVRPSEEEARKEAMSAWRAKAMAFGEPYASWRIAVDKLFHCLPRKDGSFECLANAMPCTIDQAPSRRELRENRTDM